jgi:excisionase family DNA binding protein
MRGSLVLSERLLSVPEVAARLGVTPARVRALIAAGLLDATKIGERWLVSDSSLERRRRSGFRAGRPLTPRRAWGLLLLASGRRPAWLSAPEVSRLRGWLDIDRLREIVPKLRTRAIVHPLRAHPAELDRIALAVVRAGVGAATAYQVDLVPLAGRVDGYVERRDLARLVKQHVLVPSPRPNLVLRAVAGPWPFAAGETVAPAAVVAVDLCESDDARERRAGEELLRSLVP